MALYLATKMFNVNEYSHYVTKRLIFQGFVVQPLRTHGQKTGGYACRCEADWVGLCVYPRSEWRKLRERNEALDYRIYAPATAALASTVSATPYVRNRKTQSHRFRNRK